MRSITAAAFALLATAAHAQQQPQCVPTEALVKTLEKDFGEVPVGFGLSGSGMFVLFASAGGATWTLVLNRGPVLCLLASGTEWQGTPFEPQPKPDRGA